MYDIFLAKFLSNNIKLIDTVVEDKHDLEGTCTIKTESSALSTS